MPRLRVMHLFVQSTFSVSFPLANPSRIGDSVWPANLPARNLQAILSSISSPTSIRPPSVAAHLRRKSAAFQAWRNLPRRAFAQGSAHSGRGFGRPPEMRTMPPATLAVHLPPRNLSHPHLQSMRPRQAARRTHQACHSPLRQAALPTRRQPRPARHRSGNLLSSGRGSLLDNSCAVELQYGMSTNAPALKC